MTINAIFNSIFLKDKILSILNKLGYKIIDNGDILTLKIPDEELIKSKSLFGDNFIQITKTFFSRQ